MKYLALLFILLVARAVEEPEPINEQEMHDEIAQSQTRAKWIACLLIASEKLEHSSSHIQEVASKSPHTHEVIVKKLAADILESCEAKITWRQAEEILSEEHGEDIKAFIAAASEVNLEQFSSPTVKYTARQEQLIKDIGEEMIRQDDGFDQIPPVVPEILENKADMNKFYILFGGAAIICLWVLWKLCSSEPEETKEKEPRKKKRE